MHPRVESSVHQIVRFSILTTGAVCLLGGCAWMNTGGAPPRPAWQSAVDQHIKQLGYRNWIVVAEASFPAFSRPGVRQVNAAVEVPEALDYVLNALERTENTRPNVYLARELRSVENDYAPGIEQLREQIHGSLHGHQAIEIDHQSLLILLEDANRNFDLLVIRTQSALPYSSAYLELMPGYWDVDSEARLRERIQTERGRKTSPSAD